MDKLPQTLVSVRSVVRSIIYRAALQPAACGCFGFLIGTEEEWTRPIFDHALVVRTLPDAASIWKIPAALRTTLAAGELVAAVAEAEPLAIFAAWSEHRFAQHRQALGMLMDTAVELGLSYVAFYPTHAGETCWAESFYLPNHFPQDALPWKRLPRRSDMPQHNRRRITKLWQARLAPASVKKTL